MSKWIGKKYNWDDDYPIIEGSHYLKCPKCGYKHPIYIYSPWTNKITLASVHSEKIEIPTYCSRCGEKNYDKEGER